MKANLKKPCIENGSSFFPGPHLLCKAKWMSLTPLRDAYAVLIVSALALAPAWINYDIISNDGASYYLPITELLREGKFLENIHSGLRPLIVPLYEILIAVTATITGLGLETSGRLVSAVCFLLAAVGMYKTADVLFRNRAISFVSVLLLLANRELLECSVDCLKESLLAALVIWGNFFMLKGLPVQGRARFILLGCAFFLAGGFVRSTSLIFLVAWGLLWVFHRKERLFVRAFVFLLPILLFLALYYLNSRYSWEMPLFHRSYNVAVLLKDGFSTFGLLENFIETIRQFLAKWYYLIAIFGAIGWCALRRETYARLFLLVFTLFFLVLALTEFFTIDRYTILPVVALYPLAAYALVSSLRSGNRFAKMAAGLTIVFCFFLWGQKAFTPADPHKVARKEAGEWIVSRVGPRKELVTNKTSIGFYARTTPYDIVALTDLESDSQVIAKKSKYSYFKRKKVRASDLSDAHGLTMVVALDLDDKARETGLIKQKLEAWRLEPDKTIGTIEIYLPGS